VIKYIVVMVIVLVVLGLARPALRRMGFGRLPGDFTVTIRGSRVPVPLTSTILVSLAFTAVLAIFGR
jgi:hypothetical protein